MSVRVMAWVWESSQSKGMDRLVLLAIADCASDDGGNAYPSMTKLVQKTGMSDRGIQKALIRLVAQQELKIRRNGGPGGCNKYQVRMLTPEPRSPRTTFTPPNHVHPPEHSSPPEQGSPRMSFPTPEPRSPLPPNTVHPTPEHSSPGTILEPSVEPSTKNLPAATPPTDARPTQRSKVITDAYSRAEPMSKWPAVNAIVLKAIDADRWSDEQIRDALLRLAADRRSVTVDSLRIELAGPPANRSGLVERNGLRLKPETAARLDDVERFRAMDAARERLALEGRPL